MREALLTHSKWLQIAATAAIAILALELVADDELLDETDASQLNLGSAQDISDASTLDTDHTSMFDRNATLYTTLSESGMDELRQALSDSQDIALSSVRHDTQFVIALRFASIDPREALEVALEFSKPDRSPLIAGLFAAWSESDLDDAVGAAARLDRDDRLVALESISSVRDDLTIAELRSIAFELGHSLHAMESESESWISELAADPTEAWRTLTHDGLDDSTQIDSLVAVAEAAIEENGLDALFHLQGPVGLYWNTSFWEEEILNRVVGALIRNDPTSTWAYVQAGSNNSSIRLRDQSDPQGTESVSQRDRAFMTDVVQELLLKSWADRYPSLVLDRIGQVPRKLQELACRRALVALAKTEPERAIGLMKELKHLGASRHWTVRRTVEQWSSANPSAALEWVLTSEEVDHLPSGELLMQVLKNLVLEDAERAIAVAAKQPNSSRLEALLLDHLARTDAQAAVELLPSASREAIDAATKFVADSLFRNGEVDQALGLLLKLEESSENPDAVNWFMSFLTWASANPIQLYERLDNMEPKLRYWGAYALDYNYASALTQEQKDVVHAIREEGKP